MKSIYRSVSILCLIIVVDLQATLHQSIANSTSTSVLAGNGTRIEQPKQYDQNPRQTQNETRFFCKNSSVPKSIPLHRMCDHVKDCADGSDERRFTCRGLSLESHYSPGEFICRLPNGTIEKKISYSKVCDGKRDCLTGDDERSAGEASENCDHNPCISNPDACSHVCINKFGQILCKCRDGYQSDWLSNQTVCVDINECNRWGTCSQICENNPGHFTCKCKQNYFLDEKNGWRCIAQQHRHYIVLYAGNADRVIGLFDPQNSQHHLFLQNSLENSQLTDVDYGYCTEDSICVVWTEVSYRDSSTDLIRSVIGRHNFSLISTNRITLPRGLSPVTSLSYHSAYDNTYLCSAKGIHIYSHRTNQLALLHRGLTTDVFVESQQQLVFFVKEEYKDAKIFQTDCSFHQPPQLLHTTKRSNHPTQLLWDYAMDRLVWVNPSYNQLKSIDITIKYGKESDGKPPKMVSLDVGKLGVITSFDIDNEDYFIATRGNVKTITALSKFANSATESRLGFLLKTGNRLLLNRSLDHLNVVTQRNRPIVKSRCIHQPCHHICLPSVESGYVCRCGMGYTFNNNKCRRSSVRKFVRVTPSGRVVKEKVQAFTNESQQIFVVTPLNQIIEADTSTTGCPPTQRNSLILIFVLIFVLMTVPVVFLVQCMRRLQIAPKLDALQVVWRHRNENLAASNCDNPIYVKYGQNADSEVLKKVSAVETPSMDFSQESNKLDHSDFAYSTGSQEKLIEREHQC